MKNCFYFNFSTLNFDSSILRVNVHPHELVASTASTANSDS
ncbi:hypothetical protein [Bacteroides sp.]